MRLAVQFSGLSWGKRSASLGIKVSRSQLKSAKAEEVFVNRILKLELECDPNGGDDVEGQKKMFPKASHNLTAAFQADVTGYTARKDYFGVTLKIPLAELEASDIDANHLVRFRSQAGHVTVVGGKALVATPKKLDDDRDQKKLPGAVRKARIAAKARPKGKKRAKAQD